MPEKDERTSASQRLSLNSYDFFGYLIPGFAVAGAFVLYLAYARGSDAHRLFHEYIPQMTVNQYIIFFLGFVLFSYIAGHIVSTLSAALWDRCYLGKVAGYPTRYILYAENPKRTETTEFYRAMLFLFYLMTGIYVCRRPIDELADYRIALVPFLVYFLLLLTLKFVEIVFVYIKNRSRTINTPDISPPKWLTGQIEGMSAPCAAIFSVFEVSIINAMGMGRHFDSEMRQLFEDKFKRRFYLDASSPKLASEVFWLTHWHVVENTTRTRDSIYNWLLLYGMLRNIGGAFLVAAILLSFPFLSLSGKQAIGPVTKSIPLLLFFGSILCTIRYLYIYSSYYTKSVLRGFIVSSGR